VKNKKGDQFRLRFDLRKVENIAGNMGSSSMNSGLADCWFIDVGLMWDSLV